MILMMMIQRMVMLKKHIRLVARMGAELLIYWTKMIAEQVSWVLWSVQKKNVEVANFYMLKCYMSSARWGKRAMCICGWIEWMRSDFCHKFSLNGMDKFFHRGGHWTRSSCRLHWSSDLSKMLLDFSSISREICRWGMTDETNHNFGPNHLHNICSFPFIYWGSFLWIWFLLDWAMSPILQKRDMLFCELSAWLWVWF